MILDNKDFYPTPEDVIDIMLLGQDLRNMIVLEPSAGKGNIVDRLLLEQAEVLACEKDSILRNTLRGKCNIINDDFLNVKKEDISHIDYIIANPPFSSQNKHILHMWEIAPEGCKIITLCNDVLFDGNSFDKRIIKQIVANNGNKTYLGNCFSSSERETDVNVSMIVLNKPKTSSDFEFEGYFDLSEEYESQESGLMSYNVVRDIVGRYVGAVKMFDDVMKKSNEINDLIEPIGISQPIKFGAYYTDRNNFRDITRDAFKKDLQKKSWKAVFDKLNMQRFVTSSVLETLNKFVETQENVPFTMNNIYKMIEMILVTHKERMDKILESVFDRVTKHTHANRHNVEGWKTNGAYFVGKKFIINNALDEFWNNTIHIKYNMIEFLIDVTKAFCYVQGIKYCYKMNIEKAIEAFSPCFGEWFDWGFFEVKIYKKGTMHLKFKEDKLWSDFNIRVAKVKGWNGLPEKINTKI